MGDERHEWLKQPPPPWDSSYVPPPAPPARPLSAPAPQAPEPSRGGNGWFGPAAAATVLLLVLIVSLTLVLRARNDAPSAVASGATPQPWPTPGAGSAPPAAPTPTPTPTPTPGGSAGTPGTGADPASPTTTAVHPIVPGVYVAMGSANIEGVPDDTALEFAVAGSGDTTRIAYVAGFGMRPTICKPGARQPSPSGITFLDDEVKRQRRSDDGTQLTGAFSNLKLHIEADGAPGHVIGSFKFAFDGSKGCRGKIFFEANLQRPGQPTMYDQILRAAGR